MWELCSLCVQVIFYQLPCIIRRHKKGQKHEQPAFVAEDVIKSGKKLL
jgi:hypothetical protein